MKLRNILQLAGLVAVVSGCSTQQPIAAPASATGYRQGPVTAEGTVVATRRFQLRSAPSISAKTVALYRKGDRLDASIRPYDEIWHFIEVDKGPEGYVFGIPLHSAN